MGRCLNCKTLRRCGARLIENGAVIELEAQVSHTDVDPVARARAPPAPPPPSSTGFLN